jgi:hypothetical protein
MGAIARKILDMPDVAEAANLTFLKPEERSIVSPPISRPFPRVVTQTVKED